MKRFSLTFGLLVFLASFIAPCLAAPTPAETTPITYSLNDCLKLAIDNNPEMRAASSVFLAAKGQVIQLHAILYPTVGAFAQTTPLIFYVQINQVIYSHATFPQLRAARLTTDQAYINYRQTLDSVVFQVRQAFTNVVAAQERVELFQKFTDEKTEAVKVAQQLFDAGKIQKSVVKNIEVQANISQQRQINFELNITQAKLFLENLVGQKFPTSARFKGDLSINLPAELNSGALVGEALRDREDLKLLESQQLTAEQKVQIDMKRAYPIIGFSSNSTIQPPALAFASDFNPTANYNEPSTVVAAGQTQLPLSLYANWVFFDGGLTRGKKMSNEANIATRDVAIEQLKEAIANEVTSAVSRINTQRSSLKAMGEEPKTDEIRRLAQSGYEAGELRQLDKVNLENDLLAEQLLRLSSEYELCIAAAALDHALGHSLKIARSAPPQPHP